MILNTKEFSAVCKNILFAIDTKNATLFNETLELVADNNTKLKMNVTNREYFVTVFFDLPEATTFNAAVNAKLFLDLISKITSETIEITQEDTFIKIKGNGSYKLPMIYNQEELMKLPPIEIENVTNEMTINSDILQSILTYNSKELQRGVAVKPVQNYYYVDEHGAITFTSGACVNNFELEKPLSVLLSDKVVKLFKLFKNSESVKFTMGQDPIGDDIIQTKVRFETDVVVLTAKLSDSGLITSVPVDVIRGMSSKNYDYSVVIHKDELVQALSRLMLFNDETKNYGKFVFGKESVVISDWSSDNNEEVKYQNECANLESYSALLNIDNLNLIVSGCETDYITLCFGDGRSFSCIKPNIVDIIPELKENN